MLIQYKIIKDMNLLISKFTGDFSVEEYKSFWIYLAKDPDWKYVKKVFSDYTSINEDINIALNNIDDILLFSENNVEKDIFTVILLENPLPIAAAKIYKKQLKAIGYNFESCSNINYAKHLLDLNISVKEFESLLMSIKEPEYASLW